MRKGFTLMEIIVVLAIMSIIGGISALSINYYKTMKNKVDADYYCNAVVNFINTSKMYCRENSSYANVDFDEVNGEISLTSGAHLVKKLTLKNKINSFKFTGRRSDKYIVIDNTGYSNDSFTIILKDNNSVKHEITMRVGTAYVKIKE